MIDYSVVIGDEESHVKLVRHADAWESTRDGEVTRIEIVSLDDGGEAILRVNGARHVVPYVIADDEIHLDFGGEVIRAEVTAGSRRKKGRQKEHSMAAPMPALVTKILVEAGREVTKGQALLILEAMKMEHQICAPYDGIVLEIRCRTGEMVQPPDDLVALERTGAPEAPR
jgi:acetyl/propionyl-CoA carboxylase alpha subunit